jgi:hypothetical protein
MFRGVDAKMSEGIRQRADAKHPPYPSPWPWGRGLMLLDGGTGR